MSNFKPANNQLRKIVSLSQFLPSKARSFALSKAFSSTTILKANY